MPSKRVTMQDIANACGLSRNTVSKVFNGRGSVPQSTKEIIIKKAEELGYGSPVESAPASPYAPGEKQSGGSIALLTAKLPRDAHFGTFFMSTFADQMSRAGYTLKIFEISPEETAQKILPPYFDREQVNGIIGIELFDAGYLDMVCALGLPTVMVDGPRSAASSLMSCDYVSMENIASIMTVVGRLSSLGAKRIGFVGDREHCCSFYERWFGFSAGLRERGIPLDERFCILAPDASPYADPDWLISQISRMPGLPDAFVCANDYLGIHIISALKKIGLSIPKDIMVTGFDGTFQATLVEPSLTSVEIPGANMGLIAASLLLSRIRQPDTPFIWLRAKTSPVWRGSTR